MPQNNRTPQVQDYRHDDATRRNNPPAGIASHGGLRETPKQQYAYNPHLPPILRFDEAGDADQIPELIQKAQQQPLTADEAKILADALKDRAPWLEWAGKREATSFAVDPVALHIHERVSAKAAIRAAARQDIQRELFADPRQEYREAVQFYQHDVDWSNRLILGDSLTVMSSLAHREDLAGKVQMIYIDPPYGINFRSNFQPTVFQRDVKDRESDLTREREQIKAYRDTWTLGVHSYLAYLRDRLIVARELLTDSGSIFVQIGDENVHRVRCLMDEVFGSENFIAEIFFRKTGSLPSGSIPSIADILLWYGKRKDKAKVHHIFVEKGEDNSAHKGYDHVESKYGHRRRLTKQEKTNLDLLPKDDRVFSPISLESLGWTEEGSMPFSFHGRSYSPRNTAHWKTTASGLTRLAKSNSIVVTGNTLRYVMYQDSFPVLPLSNMWTDVMGATNISYVVQTNPRVIQRCLLMTTDPGDLVLDPTCGAGTTAYVAENWGRRWITIDTSRVAVALARQRLLTGSFDYYELQDESKGVAGGFINKTVPHITLRSIAQNTALDPIFAKHEPILQEKLGDAKPRLGGRNARDSDGAARQTRRETETRRRESRHRCRPPTLGTPENRLEGVGSPLRYRPRLAPGVERSPNRLPHGVARQDGRRERMHRRRLRQRGTRRSAPSRPEETTRERPLQRRGGATRRRIAI